MEENNEKKRYSFIREKIVSPKKMKRSLAIAFGLLILAAAGGAVAAVVFSATQNLFKEREVTPSREEQIIIPQGRADDPDDVDLIPSGDESTEESETAATESPAEEEPLTINTLYQRISQSLIPVTLIYPLGEDWFNEPQTEERASIGFPIGESNEALYIVTDGSGYKEGTYFRISLDRELYDLEPYAIDSVSKLVMLKVPKEYVKRAYPLIDYANSTAAAIGDRVFSIGTLYGRYVAMDEGLVTYIAQTEIVVDGYAQLIYTNTPRIPGSTAILFNDKGEILGLMSDTSAGANSELVIGFGITPMNGIIRRFYSGTGGPYLGIFCRLVTSTDVLGTERATGLYVKEVLEGSPAELAGIQPGDRLISINSSRISNARSLQSVLNSFESGTEVNVLIGRWNNDAEETLTFSVTLGER